MSELLDSSPFDIASERRLVIIADWLPPDFGAVGQYMQMRARALADRGHDVTLVGLSSTANSVRHESRGKGTLEEIRLHAAPVPRGSFVGRLLWTMLTNVRLLVAAFAALRRADGILFTGSPPFLIHLLAPLGFLWKGRLVYRITDFHPECLIAAQDKPSALLRWLLALTHHWRRRIGGFEVLGEDQRKRLRATGIADDRIALVRDGSPIGLDAAAPREKLPAELAGHCVLLYSGNYGIAHEVETVAAGYEWHQRQGTGRVRLWLSAAGAGADILEQRFRARALPFHRSRPIPLERLAGLLMAADAHLVTLKDPFVGFVMPSKIYACIETKKPIIFVGSAESDVELLGRPQEAASGFWRVDCGDAEGFARVLEELADRVGKSPLPPAA
ncbi:MAG TPA: glycosyltransferase [Reyranella sp.]|nr:glycosyltransferase [Reyranella sp.]